MKRYPLLFRYRETILGNGYIAQVTLEGRALFEVEHGAETWLYGVYPGALAGSGDGPPAAYQDFRNRLTMVLFDFAEEAPDLEAFRARVERFFRQTNEITEAEWEAAREAVRQSGDDLGGLPRNPDPSPPSLMVEELIPEQASPAQNRLDSEQAVAA